MFKSTKIKEFECNYKYSIIILCLHGQAHLFLTQEATKKVIHAFISSHLDNGIDTVLRYILINIKL